LADWDLTSSQDLHTSNPMSNPMSNQMTNPTPNSNMANPLAQLNSMNPLASLNNAMNMPSNSQMNNLMNNPQLAQLNNAMKMNEQSMQLQALMNKMNPQQREPNLMQNLPALGQFRQNPLQNNFPGFPNSGSSFQGGMNPLQSLMANQLDLNKLMQMANNSNKTFKEKNGTDKGVNGNDISMKYEDLGLTLDPNQPNVNNLKN